MGGDRGAGGMPVGARPSGAGTHRRAARPAAPLRLCVCPRAPPRPTLVPPRRRGRRRRRQRRVRGGWRWGRSRKRRRGHVPPPTKSSSDRHAGASVGPFAARAGKCPPRAAAHRPRMRHAGHAFAPAGTWRADGGCLGGSATPARPAPNGLAQDSTRSERSHVEAPSEIAARQTAAPNESVKPPWRWAARRPCWSR